MAYDSKTYGQSPFGNPKKSSGAESKSAASATPTQPAAPPNIADDGLDQGPGEWKAPTPSPRQTVEKVTNEKKTTSQVSTRASSSAAKSNASTVDEATQPKIPPVVGRLAGKLGLGKLSDKLPGNLASQLQLDGVSGAETATRKSRSSTKTATGKTATGKTSKAASGKSTRKSKKAREAEAAQAETEAAIARRFQEEDRNTFLSLIYKTAISALVWAVLRLSRHELSEDADAIINIIIDPLLVSAIALVAVIAMTFWLRHLLNDLARHTQQLNMDAEETSGKNYRPTLEIVGDSLEYNPKLRKNFALLWNVSTILICSLVSYLVTSALLP
ncbi:MAG: hypothetical protein AAFN12_09225 [Cyanobacteria bacterium J06560_2]